MNIAMTNNTGRRCTGVNRLWITGSEFRRLTDICNTIDEPTTGYTGLLTLSTLLLLERTKLKDIEQLRMFLQLRTAMGGTGEKQACYGPDVAQTSAPSRFTRENRRPSIRPENII